jgi:hypothetical protein
MSTQIVPGEPGVTQEGLYSVAAWLRGSPRHRARARGATCGAL